MRAKRESRTHLAHRPSTGEYCADAKQTTRLEMPRSPRNSLDVEVIKTGSGRNVLLINGKHVPCSGTKLKLLTLLYQQKGRIVPFKILLRSLGHDGVSGKQKHILGSTSPGFEEP